MPSAVGNAAPRVRLCRPMGRRRTPRLVMDRRMQGGQRGPPCCHDASHACVSPCGDPPSAVYCSPQRPIGIRRRKPRGRSKRWSHCRPCPLTLRCCNIVLLRCGRRPHRPSVGHAVRAAGAASASASSYQRVCRWEPSIRRTGGLTSEKARASQPNVTSLMLKRYPCAGMGMFHKQAKLANVEKRD